MKLKNKIHLYTAVLFIALLVIINMSIYFLFKNLIVSSQINEVTQESERIISGVTDGLGLIEVQDLLLAYLPVEGKVEIVDMANQSIGSTFSPTDKELDQLDSQFYPMEKKEEIIIAKKHYYFHSIPIVQPDGTLANLQITKSIQSAYDQIKTLSIVLIAMTVIAMIPIIASSHLLSKIIMNPITSLTRTMKEITNSGEFKRIDMSEHSKDELNQMGQAFNHMIEILEDNFNKQEQFVSNASHELKTPLTVIESYASLLKRRGMERPEVFHESIEAIHSEAIRMKEMTEQLLLMAKPKEQWNLQFQQLTPESIVESTIKSFRNAYNREISLTIEEQININTDEKRLKQLLYIIIENAIKYSEESIKVIIGKDDNNGFIRVIDRGIGIPKEDLPKIFDRFYRVDKARARKFGGTGLGLSLAKEIAEAINANIKIDSALGVGTSVTLYFDLEKNN